jgi:hypothetical protein
MSKLNAVRTALEFEPVLNFKTAKAFRIQVPLFFCQRAEVGFDFAGIPRRLRSIAIAEQADG